MSITSKPWDLIPMDVLSQILSFLPPSSLPNVMLVSKHWLTCVQTSFNPNLTSPPWLVVMPSRSCQSLHFYNPENNHWSSIPLDFLPCQLRLVASVGCLLLCKLAATCSLQLSLVNPFTKQFKHLPNMKTLRANPAIGIILHPDNSFCLVVAGGATGASYKPALNVELLDSRRGTWSDIGTMPVEFAVRLTVWTPNESVHACDGVLYWMTSARVYSVLGFDMERKLWREVKVPMAEELVWAALVRRPRRRLGLVGGSNGEGVGRVWELRDGEEWVCVEEVALVHGKSNGSNKCVGDEGGVYVYRECELRNGILGCDEEGKWRIVHGWCGLPDVPVRAVLVRPSLSLVSTRIG